MVNKLSYRERLSLVYPDSDFTGKDKEPIGFPQVVQKVVDGKITNVVEFKVVDHSDDPYEFNDFALENLLASGADLKELKFNSVSLSLVDTVVKSIKTDK